MDSRKTLREFILCALLMAIGFVLHFATPPILFGMKPDFSLTMLFVSLMLVDNLKINYVTAIAAGIIAAITTSIPGGQIANPIDKLITATVIILLLRLLKNRINDGILATIVGIFGTLVSGTVFLSVVSIVVGLPTTFYLMMLTVVLPATVVNTIATVVGYYIVKQLSKATSFVK